MIVNNMVSSSVSGTRFVLRIGLFLLMMGGRAWGVYTFSTGTTSVDSAFVETNSLVAGFTVPSGATVTWNFNANANNITGPIIIEAGGELSIGTDGSMWSSGEITVHGLLLVANAAGTGIDSTSVLIIGENGTLSITSTAAGLNNRGIVTVRGRLNIASSGGVGLMNNGSGYSITVANSGTIVVANTAGDMGLGNLNGGSITIDEGGTIDIVNTGGYFGFYQNIGSSLVVNGAMTIANTAGTGFRNDVGTISGMGTITKTIGAAALPYLFKSTTITNAGNYIDGFVVANGATVTWDANDAVAGPIVIEGGCTLVAAQALALVGSGAISGAGTFTGLITKPSGLTNAPYFSSDATITSVSGYLDGFTVANGATVTWSANNSSTPIAGPIIVEEGGELDIASGKVLAMAGTLTNNGTVDVIGSIQVLAEGSVSGAVTRNGKPYLLNNTTISNGSAYAGGFTVGSGATVILNTNLAATGAIVVDGGGVLNIGSNKTLTMGTGGALYVAGVLTKNNVPYVMGNIEINAGNVATYAAGFKIAAGAVATWNSDALMNGSITFESDAAVLRLASDLHMGRNGTFVASPSKTVKIDGQGHVIVLGKSCTFDSGTTMNLVSNLVIDGNDCVMYSPELVVAGTATQLTLKNMMLCFSSTAGAFQIAEIVLQDVVVRGLHATNNMLFATDANNTHTLTIEGDVNFDSPGNRFTLMGNTMLELSIKLGSTLRIGPQTVFVAGGTTSDGTLSVDMVDANSVLHFDGCDFYSGAKGLAINGGTVMFDHTVNLYNQAFGGVANMNDKDKGLKFGRDVRVIHLNGAQVVPHGWLRINMS